MGKKKSKDDDTREEPQSQSTGVFSSLFSEDNPFRRKPQCDPPPTQKVVEIPNTEATQKKRQKRKEEAILSNEVELDSRKKRKKNLMTAVGDEPLGSPRKKRKRHEIEEEHERMISGESTEEMEENGKEKSGDEVMVGRKRKAEVHGKDMVVTKESFDDESKLLRTIFVGNLPLKTKRKVLLKEFGTFGEIESVRIRSVPILETKAPRKTAVIKGKINDAIDRVHAYIVFDDEKAAQAALSHNMAEIGGNHIRVDKACPPRKKMKGEAPVYSVKKTVFVGNLPYDVKDEEIYQLFCDDNQLKSSLEAVRVVRDPCTSVGKGIAYVLFKTREAANSVVKKVLKLRDRTLRLSHASQEAASKNLTPSKRKITAPSHSDNKRAETSSGDMEMDYKPKVKADSLSYQGLRSSKFGIHKRVPKAAGRQNSSSIGRTAAAEKKFRTGKRPAVAARKANTVKQAERKRKLESRTPEVSHGRKKARHFK